MDDARHSYDRVYRKMPLYEAQVFSFTPRLRLEQTVLTVLDQECFRRKSDSAAIAQGISWVSKAFINQKRVLRPIVNPRRDCAENGPVLLDGNPPVSADSLYGRFSTGTYRARTTPRWARGAATRIRRASHVCDRKDSVATIVAEIERRRDSDYVDAETATVCTVCERWSSRDD